MLAEENNHEQISPGKDEDITEDNLEIKHVLFATNYTAIPDLVMADKKLDPLTKLLMGVILKFIREKGGGKCFPTQSYLADMVQISERTVRKGLNDLRERGYLKWERKGLSARNYYTLKIPDSINEEDFSFTYWNIDISLFGSQKTRPEKIAELDRNGASGLERTLGSGLTIYKEEREIIKEEKHKKNNGKGGMGGNQLSLFSSSSGGNKQHNQPESITIHESGRSISTDVLVSDNISSKENSILLLLKNIPGYPFDMQKDLILLRDLLADFPHLDVPDEIKQWKAWLLGNDFGKKKINYRSRLRNWLSISSKDQDERKNSAYCKSKKRERIVDDDPYGDIPTRDIPYGDPRLDNRGDPYEDIPTRDIPYGDPRLDNRDEPDEDIYEEEIL